MKIAKKTAIALKQVSLLAALSGATFLFQNATPSVDVNAWSNTIFSRLAGRPPTDAELSTMVGFMSTNKLADATRFATSTNDFVNITAREFCAQMSTRDESPVEVFNDFTATCMGIIRDNAPASQFLTANYTYTIDPTKAEAQGIPVYNKSTGSIVNQSVLDSEGEPYQFTTFHYKVVEGKDYTFDIADALVKNNVQKVLLNKDTGAVKDLPDPAGLLTTTSFIGSHAYSGTNRRIVEYAFREFLCMPISEMMDTTVSDEFVGRDLTREPGGDPSVYQKNCRGCHAQIDGMRGAFAYFTWSGLGVTYDASTPQPKMNQNRYIHPEGKITVSDEFKNFATGATNSKYFGWRGATTGNGAKAFGAMVSQSQAFSRCMVRRAFKSVCLREPSYQETKDLVATEATKFETDSYNLKNLFGRIALSSSCINPLQAE